MGLHITSVAQLVERAPHINGIDYFIYILDYYKFGSDVIETLLKELPNLEAHFKELGNAVVVSSVGNIDFSNEVLSWHNCFGKDASEVCPAILICTLPPQYFLDKTNSKLPEIEPWLLLQLGDLCDSGVELQKLLRNIVADISEGKPLADFQVGKTLPHEQRPVITGKLKYMGFELDHGKLFEKFKSKFATQNNS